MPEELRLRRDGNVPLMVAGMSTDGRGHRSTATELGYPPTTVRQRHCTCASFGDEALLTMGEKCKGYCCATEGATAKAVDEGGARTKDALRCP